MSGEREDVPPAPTGSDQGVAGFTYNELLAELAHELQDESPKHTRLPGDVTARELQTSTGKSREAVQRFLRHKIDAGELVGLYAWDNGRQTYVYRKP